MIHKRYKDNTKMNEYALLADSLNKNKEGIPRARRIHANLDKIEALLSTGITAKYLVQCLNENGFEVTLNNFNIELYRARKKKRASIQKDATATINQTVNKPVIESTPKTEVKEDKKEVSQQQPSPAKETKETKSLDKYATTKKSIF